MAGIGGISNGENNEREGMNWKLDRPEMYDVVAGSFYDSIRLPANLIVPRSIRMFREPISNTRSFVDTNMQQSNMLPAPTQLRVDRLVISIPKVVAEEDVMNFITNYTVQMRIGDKIYIREPIMSLPMQKGQLNISPIRKCLACKACYVDLKCPNCGSPEFELFGEHDPTNPEFASNVLRFVFECSVPLVIGGQWHFSVDFEGNGFVLAPVSSEGRGLMVWVSLEGLVARGIN